MYTELSPRTTSVFSNALDSHIEYRSTSDKSSDKFHENTYFPQRADFMWTCVEIIERRMKADITLLTV